MRPMRHVRQAKREALERAAEAFFTGGKADTSRGYAKPKPLTTHSRFHIHFGSLGGNSSANQSLTGKQVKTKFKLSDNEFYSDKLDITGGSRAECQIRIGTTPSHMVKMVDKETGEEKLVKVRAKPKYRNVGLPGNQPKDGGKGFRKA